MTADIIALRKQKVPLYEHTDIPHLKRNRQSGIFYVRKFKAGKGELFESTGETKKGRALTVADQMISDWIGSKKVSGRRRRIGEICDELEIELEKEFRNGHRRRKTWNHDKTYLPIIKSYFGDTSADRFDEEYWASWVRDNARKVDRDLFDVAKYLSKVLTFAFQKKYINRKPRIKNPDKKKKKSHVVYEDADILTFHKHAEPVLKDMIVLAAENPLRPHEVCQMEWDWLEFGRDSVVLGLPAWFTKTADGRELRLSANSHTMLLRRRKTAASRYVFPSAKDPAKPMHDVLVSRMWRRMLAEVNKARIQKGLKPLPAGLKFHWLRHSFYTRALLDAKIPIQKVSEAGGTSITTLQTNYLKSNAERTAEVTTAINLKFEDSKK